MTREQVGLLGKPNIEDTKDACAWENADDDLVTIGFDKNGGVETVQWNHWPENRSVLRKLMDRVPWLYEPPPPRFRAVWTY